MIHHQIMPNKGLMKKETWFWSWKRYGECKLSWKQYGERIKLSCKRYGKRNLSGERYWERKLSWKQLG